MIRIKNFINNLSKFQKITYSIIILFLLCVLPIALPTLSRYKNRNILDNVVVWDGNIATNYRKGNGTEENPYIISNGAELAFFAEQLEDNNYENTYFALGNDILMNNGILSYDNENKITYLINNETYYVDENTGKYYEEILKTGTETGSINKFTSLNGFKGNLDGKSFRIYGLFISDLEIEELGLFTDLRGDITDLYVENSIIYGGITTGGIASSTTNANIKNTLFNGYVIGKSNISSKTIDFNINMLPIELSPTSTTTSIDLTNNNPFVGGEIISTTITGNYTLTNTTDAEAVIKINETQISNGAFEIELGTTMLDNINLIASSSTDATLTLSNVKYNVTYKYGVSGGIIAKSNNSILKNVVNRAHVYGYTISGGLVGVTTNLLSINNSYNTGDLDSEYISGGLVGVIEKSSNDIFVTKSYNIGNCFSTTNGGIISVLKNNTGNISISNVFDLSNTYAINEISNTSAIVSSSYTTNVASINMGSVQGNFESTTITELKTKNFVKTNLLYNEFVSFTDLITNKENVWVYDTDSLPIIFIDDINNPVASIHVGTYSWKNLSYDLKKIKFNNNITFSIEQLDLLNPLAEKYYYLSNKKLNDEEISNITWTEYKNIVQISNEGFYVIYVKVKDSNNNIKYLNSDLLVLDLTGATIELNTNNDTYTTLRNNPEEDYVDRLQTISIIAADNLSGINSVGYYIANEALSNNALQQLPDESWITYTEPFEVNQQQKYIVYAKVTDNSNYVSYVNSDYIIYGGYTEDNLIIGRNHSSYLNATNNITNKSTITLNFTYTKQMTETNNNIHNMISSILLPQGTKITLIDKINSKIYEYEVTTGNDEFNYNNSCSINDLECTKKATYPFTLFNEKGTGLTKKYYIENNYYNNGTINEEFTIVLDFSNTNITSNYENVNIYLELHNLDGVSIRPTLFNTLKAFNIYSNINENSASATLNVTTDYSGNTIEFNSQSTTNINITSNINYKTINELRINDTTYEDKELGLLIKMVNNHGITVSKEYLKNMIIKIGITEYYPDNDNVIRINLNNGINDSNKTITIITKENNSNYIEGLYYLKISNYVANDGKYYDKLSDVEVSIPINIVSTYSNIEHSFNVNMPDANRIINKSAQQVNLSFEIIGDGTFNNPNMKVSLYKKEQLTAYNQNYILVSLNEFISENLETYQNNIYYVPNINFDGSKNTFNVNLITQNFENTGYKFVFDLYDGTKKVGTIEKLFIVK